MRSKKSKSRKSKRKLKKINYKKSKRKYTKKRKKLIGGMLGAPQQGVQRLETNTPRDLESSEVPLAEGGDRGLGESPPPLQRVPSDTGYHGDSDDSRGRAIPLPTGGLQRTSSFNLVDAARATTSPEQLAEMRASPVPDFDQCILYAHTLRDDPEFFQAFKTIIQDGKDRALGVTDLKQMVSGSESNQGLPNPFLSYPTGGAAGGVVDPGSTPPAEPIPVQEGMQQRAAGGTAHPFVVLDGVIDGAKIKCKLSTEAARQQGFYVNILEENKFFVIEDLSVYLTRCFNRLNVSEIKQYISGDVTLSEQDQADLTQWPAEDKAGLIKKYIETIIVADQMLELALSDFDHKMATGTVVIKRDGVAAITNKK